MLSFIHMFDYVTKHMSGSTLSDVNILAETGCMVVADESIDDLLYELNIIFEIKEKDLLIVVNSHDTINEFEKKY